MHTHLGYKDDSIHPECVADLEKQIEYLGPLDFMLYHTEQVFVHGEYDEKSVRFQSTLLNQQIDERKPNWINTLIQRSVLGDETQRIQFGYEVETEFYTYLNKMPEPSAWNKFPTTEDPLTRYKFTSVEVNFSLD